jgi:AcrR family transcriptional regulator
VDNFANTDSPEEPASSRHDRKRSSARGLETRERILAAAVRLMADHGYAAASISRVSAKAKIQPGSLYWAFDSKETLFKEALNWSFSCWIENLNIGWAPSNLAELQSTIESLAGAFASEPDFLRLMILAVTEHRHGKHEILDAARKIRQDGRARFSGLILAALPKDISPQRAAVICERVANLAMHLMDGVFLSIHIEPELLEPAARFRIFGGTIVREIKYLLADETLPI